MGLSRTALVLLAGIAAVALAAVVSVLFTDGVPVFRWALAACAAAFFAAAAVYARDGYTEQAIGHGIAGIGLATTVIAGDGPGVWVGVGLIVVGGGLLLRDAIENRGGGRASV